MIVVKKETNILDHFKSPEFPIEYLISVNAELVQLIYIQNKFSN